MYLGYMPPYYTLGRCTLLYMPPYPGVPATASKVLTCGDDTFSQEVEEERVPEEKGGLFNPENKPS